jgi:hypothetical protein
MDLSNLTAEQLDELIADAVKRRADMKPEHPKEPPSNFTALLDPFFNYSVWEGNTLLRIRHPGMGWIAVLFSPASRAALASAFLHHALMAAANNAGNGNPGTSTPGADATTQITGTVH